MIVAVTHFHLPNGRTTEETTEVPDSCQAGYNAMCEHGARLTAEILRTGEVSVTIEDTEFGDFDIRVIENGPKVQEAIADMLTKFDVDKFAAWCLNASDAVNEP